MPHLPQQDADIALHLFGQRARQAWDARHAENGKNLDAFKDAVRGEWERERSKATEPTIEAPAIEGPKIGPPEKTDHQPEGPGMG